MGGQRPKPPQLHVAHGTHRKERHAPVEAIEAEGVLTEIPECPETTEAYVSCWNRVLGAMLKANYLTERDLTAVQHLCASEQDIADAEAVVAEHGEYCMTKDGGFRVHPAVLRRENAYRRALKCLQELGLTPLSRARTGTLQKAPDKKGVSMKKAKKSAS